MVSKIGRILVLFCCLPLLISAEECGETVVGGAAKRVPVIEGSFRMLAAEPLSIGPNLDAPSAQVVDHCLYKAADGKWHLWACIRGTSVGRIFYRWEGSSITNPKTQLAPKGVPLRMNPSFGEYHVDWGGGEELLQAPHVIKKSGTYYMFYGGGAHLPMTGDTNICVLTSPNGKDWQRHLDSNFKSPLFHGMTNSRDPMVLKVSDTYYLYYAAHPGGLGGVYFRTSKNLINWSEPTLCSYGGKAGTAFTAGESPFVVFLDGYFYLFRTVKTGANELTHVYRSWNPENFGINDDQYWITQLSVGAPEIVKVGTQYYITSISDFQGIRIAKLRFDLAP